jgi:hypothetical protein
MSEIWNQSNYYSFWKFSPRHFSFAGWVICPEFTSLSCFHFVHWVPLVTPGFGTYRTAVVPFNDNTPKRSHLVSDCNWWGRAVSLRGTKGAARLTPKRYKVFPIQVKYRSMETIKSSYVFVSTSHRVVTVTFNLSVNALYISKSLSSSDWI